MPSPRTHEMLTDTVVRMQIQEHVCLAPLTTLGVGGPARYFGEAFTEDDVRKAVDFVRVRGLSLFVMGGGSNLLVSDAGFPGLVLKIAVPGTTIEEAGGSALLNAGAGVEWDSVVAKAVSSNLAGIECLSGIPGSVGGTPVQNVGAYGQEVSETIEAVQALDLQHDRVVFLSEAECGFRYRSSIFNSAAKGQYVILGVTFRLTRDGPAAIKYADLRQRFPATAHPPSLAQVREVVKEIRHSKGMLITTGDEDCRSAGSFFKNPVLSEAHFHKLVALAEARGLRVPSYPALDAQRKVSAAWLVEHSGFSKGFTLGAAGISQKHALALINRGGARASEIVELRNRICTAVAETWGIPLDPEPVLVGF